MVHIAEPELGPWALGHPFCWAAQHCDKCYDGLAREAVWRCHVSIAVSSSVPGSGPGSMLTRGHGRGYIVSGYYIDSLQAGLMFLDLARLSVSVFCPCLTSGSRRHWLCYLTRQIEAFSCLNVAMFRLRAKGLWLETRNLFSTLIPGASK